MSEIVCRNHLEAEFESMIARFVDPTTSTTISTGSKDLNFKDTSFKDTDSKESNTNEHNHNSSLNVKIEDIINFYAINEKFIDSEAIVRAFVTSLHFARSEESATLSKWLVKIRSDILKSITPRLMSNILLKKLMNMIESSDYSREFTNRYIEWLVTAYCQNNPPVIRRDTILRFINKINRIMLDATRKTVPTIEDARLANCFIELVGFLRTMHDNE